MDNGKETTAKAIKARFAPSPTGHIHLGNARTALFNYLYAKSAGGQFFIRIEDTDRERSRQEFIDKLFVDLRRLGISWNDENNVYQSARADIYNKYFSKLEEQGLAYNCYCTEEELEKSRKAQLRAHKAPRYLGTCRDLSESDRAAKEAAGLKPALRFNVSTGKKVIFEDLIQHKKAFSINDIGDFIIRKSTGGASFFFTNAIDDALGSVTHALRGEDHLTNTPRQILLLQALNLMGPEYGHMPLIVGDDNKPLSKRNGSMSLDECFAKGILPIALLNYLARLGHKYESNDLLSMDELCKFFSLTHIGRSPSKFDLKQLEHWQKEAVAKLDMQEFYSWVEALLPNNITEDKKELFYLTVRHNVLKPQDAAFWYKKMFEELEFDAKTKEVINSVDDSYYQYALEAIQNYGSDYKKVVASLKEATSLKGKALFLPLRVAVTGELSGPELIHVFELLAKDELIIRIQRARDVKAL